MTTMKAVVLKQTGPAPTSLILEERPMPVPKPGQVLIRIKSFGLNHSELALRLDEPNPLGSISLPRIMGIECIGTIESDPDGSLPKGTVVMAALGGMGRAFDGAYAEFCVVLKTSTITVAKSEAELKLGYDVLGALPEMLQTSHMCLFHTLKLKQGERLIIRGATSSIGLAAISLAKNAGAEVWATSRSSANESVLRDAGAAHVLIDGGSIQNAVKAIQPDGVDKILDLVGVTTVADSLRCLALGGICCCAGTLGGKWTIENFAPIFGIPTGRYLTGFAGTAFSAQNAPWEELLQLVQNGGLKIKLGKVYRGLEKVVEAHELMERNEALGKIVVVL